MFDLRFLIIVGFVIKSMEENSNVIKISYKFMHI